MASGTQRWERIRDPESGEYLTLPHYTGDLLIHDTEEGKSYRLEGHDSIIRMNGFEFIGIERGWMLHSPQEEIYIDGMESGHFSMIHENNQIYQISVGGKKLLMKRDFEVYPVKEEKESIN